MIRHAAAGKVVVLGWQIQVEMTSRNPVANRFYQSMMATVDALHLSRGPKCNPSYGWRKIEGMRRIYPRRGLMFVVS